MASARISAKGGVIIPAPLRKKYRLQPGDQVRIVDYGGGLALVPAFGDPIEEAQGMLAGSTSLVEALLSQRAEDRQSDIDGRTLGSWLVPREKPSVTPSLSWSAAV